MAEIAAVNCTELTNVVGSAVPFRETMLFAEKPVPVIVSVNAVLIGPEDGLIEVNVGAGGLAMMTGSVFESDGVAGGVYTLMLTVPAVASRFDGIGADIRAD